MCAIVDANVIHEVFGDLKTDAGEAFYRWINVGRGVLVTGGEYDTELEQATRRLADYLRWASIAIGTQRLRRIPDSVVESETRRLARRKDLRSNDAHIIALARVSGARLLYSNDGNLHIDFRNRDLLSNPRGRVYSTQRNQAYDAAKRILLERTKICTTRNCGANLAAINRR